MKKEKYIFIILITLLIIVCLTIFIKNYVKYENTNKITKTPFKSLKILNSEIYLENNQRTYNITIDCSNLIDNNTQIISYELKNEFTESQISLSTYVLNNNEILTEDYQNITNIDANISVIDSNKEYEQIFHIKAICK